MQINEIADKVNSLGKAWEQFKQVNDQRNLEIERKRFADPLHSQQLNKINQHIDEYKTRISKLETAFNRPDLGTVNQDRISEEKSQFIKYLKKGIEPNNLELKALSVGSDTDGGVLVAKETNYKLLESIDNQSIFRKIATVEKISTDALEVIEDYDRAEAGWTNETDPVKETNSPKLNKKRILIHELYAQPKATQKLIDDAAIDIEKWLTKKLSYQFSALENHSFINGDGRNKPRGILSYANGKELGKIEQIEAQTNLDAASIIELYFSLKSEYASNASFLMHRSTLQAIRMLKSNETGQYLWNPGLALKNPDTILGVPVYETNDMPQFNKDTLAIAFADFKRAYKIIDRAGVKLLRDPFTEKPFIKFYTTKRVGGDVVNTEALKILKIV